MIHSYSIIMKVPVKNSEDYMRFCQIPMGILNNKIQIKLIELFQIKKEIQFLITNNLLKSNIMSTSAKLDLILIKTPMNL